MSDGIDWVDLIRRVLAGEPKAAEIFCAEVRRFLMRFLLRRWPDDADDVAQEVLKKLFEDDWRRLRSFDFRRGQVETFVCVIADRCATDRWRADNRKGMPRREDWDKVAEILALGLPPGAELDAQRILRAVERLSPRDKLIARWLIKEVTRDEMARLLGITSGALDLAIKRMRDRLRGLLDDME